MGPHSASMSVLADDCERQVQCERGRQSLLTAEGLSGPAWTTPRLHDVAAALANMPTTPRRAARPLSWFVGLPVVQLLLEESVCSDRSIYARLRGNPEPGPGLWALDQLSRLHDREGSVHPPDRP